MISQKNPSKNFFRARLAAGAAVIALAAAGAITATADVTLAPLFQDNAVLQREKPVPVWGRADPGEKVTVAFAGQTVSATAGADGRWLVTLAPMPASAEPREMTITSIPASTSPRAAAHSDQSKIENPKSKISNILVGEVWLCSGQSNMAFLVKRATNSAKETAAANYPLIRHFKTKLTAAALPCDEVEGDWAVCSPETVPEFSAAAYFFAREIFQKLNVPVGLVNSSWGGTPVESWTSAKGLAGDPAWPAVSKRWLETMVSFPERLAAYQKTLAAWEKEAADAKAAKQKFTKARPRAVLGMGTRAQPSSLYNAMIAPLLPYAIRGAIWYQGEANASRYAEYRTLFPTMIRQWREDFGQGDFPFYYVQLANYARGADYAFQREAQQCALKLPATGEAVIIDIGQADDIHPTNKQDVGRRLALNALAKDYGFKIEYSGPVFAGVTTEKGGALRVTFTHAAGLKTKDPAMEGFVIAGADKKFTPAKARIEGESVVVSAAEVPKPVAVRYAWAPDPKAPLYNGDNLPASPFRTDDWE